MEFLGYQGGSMLPPFEVLQKLVKLNFFAPNKSMMIKELGRKDKNILYRRLSEDSVIGDKALKSICESICHTYGLSEITFLGIPYLWDDAKMMSERMPNADFIALVNKDLSEVDKSLLHPMSILVKELSLEYYYTLALFYAFTHNLDPNNKKEDVIYEAIKNVDCILRQHFPENISAHLVAEEFCAQLQASRKLGWCNLMIMLGKVIGCYSDLNFALNISYQEGRIMSFPYISWWVADNADEADHAKIYGVKLSDEKSAVYNMFVFDAKYDEGICEESCTFYRGIFYEEYKSLYCVQVDNNKIVKFGLYEYELVEKDSDTWLNLKANDSFAKEKHLQMPSTLHLLMENTKWGKWLDSVDSNVFHRISVDLIHQAQGMDKTNYELNNILLSLKSCMLVIGIPGYPSASYVLTYEEYPSLREISVWDTVEILQRQQDQMLYAVWSDKGIHIPLKPTYKSNYEV